MPPLAGPAGAEQQQQAHRRARLQSGDISGGDELTPEVIGALSGAGGQLTRGVRACLCMCLPITISDSHVRGRSPSPSPRPSTATLARSHTAWPRLQNTRPLRVHPDFSGLYPETALPHSACFELNGWFKWNFPERAAPPCASPDWSAALPCGRPLQVPVQRLAPSYAPPFVCGESLLQLQAHVMAARAAVRPDDRRVQPGLLGRLHPGRRADPRHALTLQENRFLAETWGRLMADRGNVFGCAGFAGADPRDAGLDD